jgi:hypothetical protein
MLTGFLLKIAVPPILVALMSLATRIWGPTVGGLLMGLPWMTGPVLFFLALDKGDAFAAGACAGIELGIVCICAFMLAYGIVSAFAAWPVCLVAAGASFVATAWLVRDVEVSLGEAALIAVVSLAVSLALLPRPRTSAVQVPLPWWDIPARVVTTLGLVAIIMLSADALGPRLSGVASTYPVILTVIGAFAHQQSGRDAVLRVLRGLTVSLLSFVAFFLVVGWMLAPLGLAGAFTVASAVSLTIGAALFAFTRRRALG